MIIGLISDTHSYLDPSVFDHFKNVDEIWHGGDIGDQSVIRDLQKFKPVRAVFGNIDEKKVQDEFLEDLWFDCEGLRSG